MKIHYREFVEQDLSSVAELRSKDPDAKVHWMKRISGYYNGLVHPQEALAPRIIFVAVCDHEIVGFIAGHLSRRFNCSGELQWINTAGEFQGTGVGSGLLTMLARWFVEQEAYKICVDPGNSLARSFYRKNGATDLNEHWMFWNDIRNIL